MSRAIPVSTPASIAGLPDCNWKLLPAIETNLGSTLTPPERYEGAAPLPKKRLLFPENQVVDELGEKYDSPETESIILSTNVTGAEAVTPPESLLARRPQS